jgi:ABC-type cobalamin transport system permease subunit
VEKGAVYQMKKRPKRWVFAEMLLMFLGLLLAIYNGKYWESPTVLFSILMVIFVFRAVERKVFKQKTEFWFNVGMAGIFLVLGVIPLL